MSKTKKIKRQIEKHVEEEIQEVNLDKKEDYINLLKIIIAIIVFLGLAYVYTRTFITKDWTEPEVVEPETSIDYNSIVSQQVLSQSEETYYVLYTDKSSETEYINYQIQGQTKVLDKMYQVDTTQVFNEDVITEGEYTKEPQNVEEIKIGELPTLIKVENGKVVEFVEGKYVADYISQLLITAEDK